MELPNDLLRAESERISDAPEVNAQLVEDDPELERELQQFAQWLLDVYLWKLQQERKARGIEQMGKIDNRPPPATI
jgi:hypothetical protein